MSQLTEYLRSDKPPTERARTLIGHSGLFFREQFVTEAEKLIQELRGEDDERQRLRNRLQHMVNARRVQSS